MGLLILGCLACGFADGEQLGGEKQELMGRKVAGKLFQTYCYDCHASDGAEADVRLDQLDLSLRTPADTRTLENVLDAVVDQRMPPEDADPIDPGERRQLVSWLSSRLEQTAQRSRDDGSWTSNRRLTNAEYEFTLQHLFGVDAAFANGLPPDPVSPEGYENCSRLLRLSSLRMECYLDSARQAVQRYVRVGPVQEQPIRYHVDFDDLYYSTADRYGTREQAPQPVDEFKFRSLQKQRRAAAPSYIPPLSPIPFGRFPTAEKLRAAIPKLHQQFLAIPRCTSIGEMIVRVRAAGTADQNGRFPRMRVESGITLGDGCSMDTRVMGELDVNAPMHAPATYEFRIRMEDVPTKGELRDEESYDRLSVFDMNQIFISNVSRDDRAIYDLGRGGYGKQKTALKKVKRQLQEMRDWGANFLYLDFVEVEMLPNHTEVGDYKWTLEPSLKDAPAREQKEFASTFLTRFMSRAYRRPVSPAEVARKMLLFNGLRQRDHSFEESLRETLTAVLVSPSFLFVQSSLPERETASNKQTNAYRLASKLSYLLWLSPPDERLLQCAEDASLLNNKVLVEQATRLLADPRSRRFIDHFCHQWLRLGRHKNVAVSAQRHPDFDDDLADATIAETREYFAHVFTSKSSAFDLLDSDYAFLNDRLAKHYGLEPVPGGDLRKVPLPAESIRGGLLTQASVLTMNSDGRDSHPIRRGVWLLERMLNSPPPPPPPNVPEIDDNDPDFRGLTLKEQIALHREPNSCTGCHSKIDPWGIAFENFGATGRWRDHVDHATRGSDELVDAAVTLPGGPRVSGVHELKQHLKQERREQFSRSLVHHMLTYALGRSLDFADRKEVDAMQQQFAAGGHRLQDLVLAIVASDLFRQ